MCACVRDFNLASGTKIYLRPGFIGNRDMSDD